MEDVGNGARGCSLGCGMLWVNPTSLQVSHQLEETLEALQDAVAQGEQLAVTNSRLSTGSGGGGRAQQGGGSGLRGVPVLTALPPTDLSTVMKQLASLQQEQDALQQDYEEQKEKMSWWVCTPGASPYPIQSPLGTPNPIPWLIPIHPLASG